MSRLMASPAFADYIRSKKRNLEHPAELRLALDIDRRKLLKS
jgi:hypothetical protein